MTQKLWTIAVILVFAIPSYCLYQMNYGQAEGEKITIQRHRGDYVSGDRFKDGHLIANRIKPSEWEFFELQRIDDYHVVIHGSDQLFVGNDEIDPKYVRAREAHLNDKIHLLELVKAEDGFVLIRTQNQDFFQINENDHIIVGDGLEQNAERFRITVIKKKSESYLLDHQITLLSIGFFLVLISILTFQFVEDKRLAVFLLFAGSLFLRLFVVELAHYLHWWDEQFHALVAKNMIDHPFKPMLFANPTLAFDETSWVAGHIWLHKQPLFLWQMALSMKLFGVNTLALRLPSVMMLSLCVPITYRIGKIGFNERVGFIAALLFAVSNFGIRLSGGGINTDHNDVAFLFYVAASIWAWFEYERADLKRKKYCILLIGLFAGCAVLVKWLTGLLVFSGWGISIILSDEKRAQLSSYVHLALAFTIAILVFLPWQLYILQTFPELSRHEYGLISLHFFESIEGHGEPFWYHFEQIPELYGISQYVLFICFAVFLKAVKNSVYKVAVATYILIIYTFFSLAVTKMIAFTFCISFLICLVLGITLDKLLNIVVLHETVARKRINTVMYVTTLLVAISYYNLNLDGILDAYTMRNQDNLSFLNDRKKTQQVIDDLPKQIPQIESCVLFNCKPADAVPILFFTEMLDAHTGLPQAEEIQTLKNRGLVIAVFDNGSLPGNIYHDADIIKIAGYY